MRRPFLAALAALALAASTPLGGSASAGAIGATTGLRTAAATLATIEKTRFFRDGRWYCWYADGWRGPGWYVCDYGPWTFGRWWGGPSSWHRWHRHRHHPHRPIHVVPPRHHGRPVLPHDGRVHRRPPVVPGRSSGGPVFHSGGRTHGGGLTVHGHGPGVRHGGPAVIRGGGPGPHVGGGGPRSGGPGGPRH